jgi:hypothetical protein
MLAPAVLSQRRLFFSSAVQGSPRGPGRFVQRRVFTSVGSNPSSANFCSPSAPPLPSS